MYLATDQTRIEHGIWIPFVRVSSVFHPWLRFLSLVFVTSCAFSWPISAADAAVTSFDDIQYWIGTGENRAALAIDWADTSNDPPALVWGYRWDGTATGRDMLKAVVIADARLYTKFGGSLANPVAVYGIGYDANDDATFAIDDGTSFNAAGIAITSPADTAMTMDFEDYYAEGWFTGFWHYGIASSNPYDGGSWSSPLYGMAGRTLTDGAWDSWTYSPSFNFASYATNPIAALPPSGLPGDYNGDEIVNALDYATWVSAFGQIGANGTDGNGDSIVNAADYVFWRDRLSASRNVSLQVPEPATSWLALVFIYLTTRVIANESRKLESTKARKRWN